MLWLLQATLLRSVIVRETCQFHPNSAFENATTGAALRGVDVAACCSTCARDDSCTGYNFHPLTDTQASFCQKISGGVLVPWNPARNFSAGTVTKRPPTCVDAIDCSLAGECTNGTCVCDGWTHGKRCEILNLLPADPAHLGYRNSSGYNSWGGASIEYNGQWYLFASQVINKCPLNGYWDGGSTAVRGVSKSGPTGPFTDIETIIPRMAHNVKPFQAPDGTWLIYYIGEPDSGNPGKYANCTRKNSSLLADFEPLPRQTAGPVMIASAASPDAPPSEWKLHGPLTDSVAWHSATNRTLFQNVFEIAAIYSEYACVALVFAASPIFFKNGSVLLAVSRAWGAVSKGSCGGKRNVLMTADSWKGPYKNVSWTKSCETAIPSGEDPDLFRTKRGYHMLNHNTGPGSTLLYFSVDGLHNWTKAEGENAFNQTVRWINGSTTTVCRRQRPQIAFGSDGLPGWLWTGVGDSSPGSASCEANPTWSLAQKIGRPSDNEEFSVFSQGGAQRP
jgi:hypothetical protein